MKTLPQTLLRRVVLLALVLACTAPVLAETGAASAKGVVLDREGKPIEGVVVSFKAQSNPAIDYTGKTDRKGRYFIDGLFTAKENDRWNIAISGPGYLPVEVAIESRTVNRVLVGDIMKVPLRAGSKIPDIPIRPLGVAQVDFVMAPESEVAGQPAGGAAAIPTATAGAQPAPPAAKQDPLAEALTLAGAGDLAGALPLFQKAIEEQPADVERHEAYAKVLYQLERYPEAEAQARKAAELAPDRLAPHMMLYSIHASQKDFDRARGDLEHARAIAPNDVRVLEQIAYVAGETGRRPDSVAAYEAIVGIDPRNSSAWLALGDLYAKTGDATRSEKAYQKVAELSPDSAYQTFYNLGALIMNRDKRSDDDMRRAVAAFRKALEIKPDYAQAQQQLAFALLNLGDHTGARAALEAYVRLKPGASDAREMTALLDSLPK